MFCALNGATRQPRSRSQAQIAVAIQLFPAFDVVPPTKMGRALILLCWSSGAMANIYPFRPLRYAPKAGPIDTLATQPYDTISPELEARYRAASPYNLVHLILPGDDYAGAAARFRDWIGEGILVREESPALFVYEQQFVLPESSERLVRRGFIGLSDTENYGQTVHRHERTLDAPKADRLALLRHTRAQFGSIFMLYPDEAGSVDTLLDQAAAGEPIAVFTDHQQTTHLLWRHVDAAWIARVQSAMGEKPLIIADGHHRYEAALQFGAPRTMMTFVSLQSRGLRSLAAHRVVSGRRWVAPGTPAPGTPASGTPLGSVAHLHAAWENTPRGRVRFGAADSQGLRLLEFERPAGVLNLPVLHQQVLQAQMGIAPDAIARQEFVSYRRGIGAAIDEVHSGKADVAFLVEPLDVKDVARLALSGEILPQKSTDFYPKLASGLTIYHHALDHLGPA